MARKPYVPQRQLNRAIYLIGTNGVKGFDRNELKQLGLPIIREARKRVRALEEAGLTDSPAYRAYVVDKGMKATTEGKDINKIRHEVFEAWTFLNASTSSVKGASEYNKWLDKHLGAETTKEEREYIWDIVHKFEKSHTGHFINYGYDEAIRKIAEITKASGYNIGEIIQLEENLPEDDRIITKKVGAYLSYKGDLSIESLREFLASESEKIEIDNLFGKELDKESISVWMKKRGHSIRGL